MECVSMDAIRRSVETCGFHESGAIATAQLEFSEEIRHICETGCRNYGKSWACPPAVGTVAQCAQRCREFETLLLLSAKYELEDSFDFEGMMEGMRDFKRLMERLDDTLRGKVEHYQLLSNEGCGRCKTCTYPDAPCRFEEKLHHSIEGYGLNVSELAKMAGVRYNNGPNTVTYFGGVLL